jgi:hypothetical protein
VRFWVELTLDRAKAQTFRSAVIDAGIHEKREAAEAALPSVIGWPR